MSNRIPPFTRIPTSPYVPPPIPVPYPPTNAAKITRSDGTSGTSHAFAAGVADMASLTALTICAAIDCKTTTWFNQASKPTTMCSFYDSTGSPQNPIYGFEVTGAASGAPFLNAKITSAGGTTTLTQAAIGATSAHYAMTWDGATVILYVNGVSVSSSAFAGPLKSVTLANTRYGLNSNKVFTVNLSGTCDVRVANQSLYSRCLTAAEVAALAAGTTLPLFPLHLHTLQANGNDTGIGTAANLTIEAGITFAAY